MQNPLEIDLRPHLGIQRCPGSSMGTPGTENDAQIDEKTIKKASIPCCFSNILCATLGDTVPQKGEHSVLFSYLTLGGSSLCANSAKCTLF